LLFESKNDIYEIRNYANYIFDRDPSLPFGMTTRWQSDDEYMKFFETIHQDKKSRARAGIIRTEHGDIETPIFMPVGTQAVVKTLDSEDLEKINAQIILGNTYHLHLRSGENLIAEIGGLHKFMNWNKPILTDSGGFQVFSLGKSLVKIDDDGVSFRSHIDGSKHRFTPESAIEIQNKLGADIIMAFDECTPDDAPYEYAREALNRTHDWAKRCLDFHQKNKKNEKQFLFGIIQGAKHKDLREESARFISSLDFNGIAIGGESIGYNMEATKEIMDWVVPIIPEDKPRYTMGVGLDPADLLQVVESGADMFDCVAPTRLARHGVLFISDKADCKHRLNITNAKYTKDASPIDKKCECPICLKYTRAYIHHLFLADEMTGMRLASIHNLYFMLDLMRKTRQAILEDNFMEFKKKWK